MYIKIMCAIILKNVKYPQSSSNISSNISAIFKYHQISSGISFKTYNIYHQIHQTYQIHEIHQHIYHIYITKFISSIFCWIKLFKLKGCSKRLDWLRFLPKKNQKNIDFVCGKKTSKLSFYSWFKIRYFNCFNTHSFN